MASSPSPSPDLDPGQHTEPGDVRVILQPHVHETMGTLAAYLGFDHIANLKQCLFSPLVVMITRLLWPLVYDLSDSSYMDKIFAWFLETGSDTQFRAHYARSADVVTTCLRDALNNSDVAWEDDDDVARAIACLLVWASDVLSGAGDMSQRRASLPGAGVGPLLDLRQASGGQFATLLDAVYGVAGKVTWDGRTLEEAVGVMRLVDKIKWSPRIRPMIGHYPDYREHAFEKYNRVLALVRGCAQEMFKLARLSNRCDQTDLRHLGAATEEHRRLADECKHTTIKAFYFGEQLIRQYGDDSDFPDCDRNRWVRASDRPAWMRNGGGVDWESYVPENLRD